ncbi:hypothetical protein QAD02_013330 [Eretmocerus hayati]|uniref:Uncharacterized protein n=1 Tax=Eretmocerus hayati TaxID=131215 RepID=A0ACC2P244_9HYME|nr:hypothetical protein QAD02_013330 [Eretmocerus hayati]
MSRSNLTSECCSPYSAPRESFSSVEHLVIKRITRCDTIDDMANSIKSEIKPLNKLMVDMLADNEKFEKYNFDSQNISLTYSITPPNIGVLERTQQLLKIFLKKVMMIPRPLKFLKMM